MPITQNRMLALVAAAQDYEQAWAKVRRAYNSIAESLHSHKLTIEQAWPELDFMFTSQLFLSDPEGTLRTIAAESAHFKAVSKRNEKSAQWQRERREGRPARSASEVQDRIAESNLKRSLARFNTSPNSPNSPNVITKSIQSTDGTAVLRLGNTDAQQVNADTELEFEPAEPTDAAKAAALQYLADLEAKEQYEAEGRAPASPSDVNND